MSVQGPNGGNTLAFTGSGVFIAGTYLSATQVALWSLLVVVVGIVMLLIARRNTLPAAVGNRVRRGFKRLKRGGRK